MQFRRVLLGFLLSLALSGLAYGGDSVIGEQELMGASSGTEAAPKEEKLVGYDKGFFIKSRNGKYKLVIGGYLQLQFNLMSEGGETEYGFRVRRARLAFKGHLFTPRFTYKLQFDFAKFQTELLLDAYVNYAILLDKYMEVRVGQQTIPYIRQHQISSSNQQFIDRSLASKEFINADDVDSDGDGVPDKLVKNGRDIGIQLHGMPYGKKFEYQVGIFNGHGTNTTNVNNDFLYMGRFVGNIMGFAGYGYEGDWEDRESPALALGGSANYNVRNISGDKVTSLGAEGVLKWKGFSLTGEFFFRNINPGDPLLTNTNDIGYYAQAGYFVLPKRFEVAVRASQVFNQGPLNDAGEFQIGMNGFLYGKYLKLQTDYSYLPTNSINGIEHNQRWRLRLQTKF